LEAKKKVGKHLLLSISEEEVSQLIQKYQTLEVDLSLQEGKRIAKLPAYRILTKARTFGINTKIGNLFPLKRDLPTNNLTRAYFDHWLYYASFSPLWKKRIENFQGTMDTTQKSIQFPKEDLEEAFYLCYGYEPDEQTKECHNQSIQPLVKTTWREWFETEYQKPRQNKLFTIPVEYLLEM
jgi:hypothetical protein